MATRTISIATAAAIAVLATNGAALADDSSFFGTFWSSLVQNMEQSSSGGTVKSGDYETVCDKQPSRCGGDVDLPDRGSGNTPGGDDASDHQKSQ